MVTAFGLLSTVDVFTNLLSAGPTPQRVVDALPALAVVVGALMARGALQSASGSVQARLVPRIEERAQDELYTGLADVELAAFDDADFTTLVQRSEHALVHLRFGASLVGDLAAAVVSVGAAVVTAGLLHPVLAPLVLLAALPQGWAGVRGAQLRMAANVRINATLMRRFVTGDLLSERQNAAELRAFTTRDVVLGEHRRIAADLAEDEVRVGLQQNRVTTVGRALSGIGSAVGYCGLGLLLYEARSRWRWPGPQSWRCAPRRSRSPPGSSRSTGCSSWDCTWTSTARAWTTSPPGGGPRPCTPWTAARRRSRSPT